MNEACPVRKTVRDYGKDADTKTFISRNEPHYTQIYRLNIQEGWATKIYLLDGESIKVPLDHIGMDWEASEEEIKKVNEMALIMGRSRESQLIQKQQIL